MSGELSVYWRTEKSLLDSKRLIVYRFKHKYSLAES